MIRRQRRRTGFTLIELLIAMVLSAMLLFVTASVYRVALSGRERLRARGAEVDALRRTFETLTRDFHSAVLPPDDSGLQFGLTASPAGGSSSLLQFASAVGEPLLAGRSANETVLIQYGIAEDPRSGKPTLWRYETPYPVPDGATAGQSQDTRTTALLPNVAGMTYLFYSETDQTWTETWDSATAMPTAIRMDLLLDRGEGRDPRQESWVFTLPAARYANEEAEEAAAAESGTGTGTAGGAAGGGQ